ncbi:MAG: DEAD/DEAH box helicase [Flammeovirgaceae bacterium]
MSFAHLGLSEELEAALVKQHYQQPYPIQEQAIPAILEGNDVLGIAKTGSGKTASFVLPILQQLQKSNTPKSRNIKVLVLVPTRELAVQVQEVFHQFGSALPNHIKSMAVYGGVSINPQMKALYGTQILVATPGRLLELVENKAVGLSVVRILVLDEADKMLNLGFEKEMQQVLAKLPTQRQNLLFSATLNEQIEGIKQLLLADPVVIKIKKKAEALPDLDQIKQSAYLVTPERKGPLLRYLIKHHGWKQVLVFVSSVYSAKHVSEKLRKNGIDAEAVHSKKGQGARMFALKQFKEGVLPVLVATDLLARGIDIEGLPHVINYELPRSPKDYIHRIGRTGRAAATGEAISLITEEDLHHFKVIQKKMKKQVELLDSGEINLQGY